MRHYNKSVDFSVLKGKTIIATEYLAADNNEVTIHCSDGSIYQMYHSQDCCESVYIESVVGDVEDLIGHEILLAEEVTNADAPSDFKGYEYADSEEEWTFYKLATIKGYVDIRWYGTSNGYYSTSVDFECVKEAD